MRRTFTLIEILIAVLILSFLFMAMSRLLQQSKTVQNIMERSSARYTQKHRVATVLYHDLLQADTITIEPSPDENYCRLFLRTANSLYDIVEPYVVWYVSTRRDALIRVESFDPIRLPDPQLFYLDRFAKNVRIFRIYRNDQKLFVYIDDGKPLFFEMIGGSVHKIHAKHGQEQGRDDKTDGTTHENDEGRFEKTQ